MVPRFMQSVIALELVQFDIVILYAFQNNAAHHCISNKAQDLKICCKWLLLYLVYLMVESVQVYAVTMCTVRPVHWTAL